MRRLSCLREEWAKPRGRKSRRCPCGKAIEAQPSLWPDRVIDETARSRAGRPAGKLIHPLGHARARRRRARNRNPCGRKGSAHSRAGSTRKTAPVDPTISARSIASPREQSVLSPLASYYFLTGEQIRASHSAQPPARSDGLASSRPWARARFRFQHPARSLRLITKTRPTGSTRRAFTHDASPVAGCWIKTSRQATWRLKSPTASPPGRLRMRGELDPEWITPARIDMSAKPPITSIRRLRRDRREGPGRDMAARNAEDG